MGETDLTEIETRLDLYPAQARHDILRLTSELRRLYAASTGQNATQPMSPLYDVLTGLLNGGAYGVRFAMARARATRYHKIFAVMSIDIDFAARAPVGAGEAEREATLKAVADRLAACVRATDTLARIGDQNFAIILEDLTQPGHAERVQQNVQESLAQPMRIAGCDVVPLTRVQLHFHPVAEPQGSVH